ncbi:MAG TPA: hypothetical protein GXZ47_07605 [Treponema sp.]|nr:hypothetical protein [Treponema sp.]
MSDFFIGELLILLLLLPVVMRPFIRRLQGIRGIVFLPPVALTVCVLIIAGSGFLFSFTPLLVITLILFFAGIPRMARAIRSLETDWYSLPSAIFYGLFFLVFFIVAFAAFFFAPETAYLGSVPIIKEVNLERVSSTVNVRHYCWKPQPDVGHKGTVIFFPDVVGGANSRNTAACILAEKGYTVFSNDYCRFHAWQNPIMAFSAFRRPVLLAGKIGGKTPLFTDDREIYRAQQGDFSLMVAEVRAAMQPGSLFILAEGSACAPAAEYLRTGGEDIRGFICLVSQQGLEATELVLDASGFTEEYTRVYSETVMTPKTASEKPVLLLSTESGSMIGRGELDANDVLAATLLGGNRDAGRKRAERLARRITDWCDSRNHVEEIQ